MMKAYRKDIHGNGNPFPEGCKKAAKRLEEFMERTADPAALFCFIPTAMPQQSNTQ